MPRWSRIFLITSGFLMAAMILTFPPQTDELVDEVEELVLQQMTPEGIKPKRYNLFDKRSYNPTSDGKWVWGDASENELMKAISFDGSTSQILASQWNEVKPKRAIVTESYETVYRNPIKLKAGESVKIEKRETNHDWLGWVYCIDSRGITGWVSKKYLKESNQSAIAIKDYDATELSAEKGENIKVYYKEFGWCWCKNQNGVKGWIPEKNIDVRD